MSKCRVSGEKIEEVIDFGLQPLGNGFLSQDQFSEEYFYNMSVGFCEKSMMLQLVHQPEPQKMFHENYAFFSGTSAHMQAHFKNLAERIINERKLLDDDSFVIELGCNDGVFLRYFADKSIRHLGIEPSANVAKVANTLGVKTINEFFNHVVADEILLQEGKADIIYAANVMCHIPDIKGVVMGMSKLLKPKGLIIFEDPYLGDIIQKGSYDQIYDEHVFLFSAHSVKFLFGLFDFELVKVEPLSTHGGSMRYYLGAIGEQEIDPSVANLLEKEREMGVHLSETYHKLAKKIQHSRDRLVNLLEELKAQGKTVSGYGATSKSTTILNYCKIGPDLLSYISDTTPIKIGKYTPGSHIPVVSRDHFTKHPTDYVFLLAWNHALEIKDKEAWFSSQGGNWISHVPDVSILKKF